MIIACVLFIVSTFDISAFLLEDKTPLPNNDLTDKHYIAVMDLLLEERKERQNLEIAMTQLHQEPLAKTSRLPKLNRTKNFSEKCNAELQALKNKTDQIQDELNAENTKLKKELSYVQQNFSKLQLEMRLELNNIENKSIDDINRVQNDLSSLKQLKAIDQLQDVHKLQNQFETIQHQVQSLTAIQSARGQDFLALYNQTLEIKSSLKQSIVDLSNNHNDSMTQFHTVLIKGVYFFKNIVVCIERLCHVG
ncbi:unnamed protein product [Mytilus coruscus]|uniref:Uncharacterized protein n=1 Tax=Mytilus coruscus TaxID=42192 RepID=A0A6J8EJL5_MYTCO|nr:unnamed protein product [Mytilus coruscus]